MLMRATLLLAVSFVLVSETRAFSAERNSNSIVGGEKTLQLCVRLRQRIIESKINEAETNFYARCAAVATGPGFKAGRPALSLCAERYLDSSLQPEQFISCLETINGGDFKESSLKLCKKASEAAATTQMDKVLLDCLKKNHAKLR